MRQLGNVATKTYHPKLANFNLIGLFVLDLYLEPHMSSNQVSYNCSSLPGLTPIEFKNPILITS